MDQTFNGTEAGMEQRDYIAEERQAAMKQVDKSPIKTVLDENTKLLDELSAEVLQLRDRTKPISSNLPETTTNASAAPGDRLRVGSSKVVEGLYEQQQRINMIASAVRTIKRNLEI